MTGKSVVAAVLVGLSRLSWALPDQPSVLRGQAQISNPAANVMQILQSSPQAIINWNGFSIGNQERVYFLQPNNLATLLNRVTGVDPSLILGSLQANGRIFLLNPNGILFGPNSTVDVGSFMASTLSMSDQDFLAGRYSLTLPPGQAMTALVNQGTIQVADGGFVVLVAPLLHNDGLIVARSGQVELAAGRQATFSVDGQGLVQFRLPDGFSPQFEHGGQGGTVLLTPGQMSQMLAQVLNLPGLSEAGSLPVAQGEGLLLQSGTVRVDGLAGQTAGAIRLDSSQATVLTPASLLSASGSQADGGTIQVLSAGPTISQGVIQADALGGNGGNIEVSGRRVSIRGSLNAGPNGQILIDPGNLTIVDGPNLSQPLDLSIPNILYPTGNPNDSVSTGAIAAFAGTVTLQATNDVTYTTSSGFSAPNTDLLVTAGNNIVIQGNPASNVDIHLHRLSLSTLGNITVTAPGNLTITTGAGDLIFGDTDRGNLTLSSGGDMTLSAAGGIVALQGPQVQASAGGKLNVNGDMGMYIIGDVGNVSLSANQIQLTSGDFLNVAGISGVQATAAAGNLTAAAQGSMLLYSESGPATLTALGGDVDFSSLNGEVLLFGQAQPVAMHATQDVKLSAPALNLWTNNILLDSGRDVNLNLASLYQSAPSNMTVQAGRDVTLSNSSALPIDIAANHLHLQAGRDLHLQSPGPFTVTADTGITLAAGRDIPVQATALNLNSANGNVTLSAGGTLDLQVTAGNVAINAQGLSLSAERNLTVAAPGTVTLSSSAGELHLGSAGNLSLSSGGGMALSASGGQLNAHGTDVTIDSGGSLTLSGQDGLNVTATAGNLSVSAASQSTLESDTGSVTLTALAGDVDLRHGNQLSLLSQAQPLAVNASNDVKLRGPFVRLFGNVSLEAGRDLDLNVDSLTQSTPSNVTIQAGRDVNLTNSTEMPVGIAANQVSVQAGRDLHLQSPTSFTVTTATGIALTAGGDVLLQAAALNLNSNGGNVTLAAGGTLDLSPASQLSIAGAGLSLQVGNANFPQDSRIDVAGNGISMVGAGSLDLSTVAVNSSGDVSLVANHDLKVNQISAPTHAFLQAGNLTLSSVANISGGNYSLTATGNLTEQTATPPGSAPTLASLDMLAGGIFGNGPHHSFSVPPTAGCLTVAVSGGNDSTQQAAGSLQQLQGANLTLTTFPQTGDVYVDGLLRYKGQGVATTNPTTNPITSRDQLTADQQAEILSSLAQSNPALGNLGSTSRVLETQDLERLTLRDLGWMSGCQLDPISPTLAVVLYPGLEAMPSQEVAQAYASLLEEGRDKDRASFNAMVDQEVREIWEVRYWRKLLEGFVIWEDSAP